MFNLEIISTFLFFFVVSLLIIKDRKNIQFRYGIVIRRWKKGIERISKFAKKYASPLRVVGNIGIVVGIVFAFIGLYFLFRFTFELKGAIGIVLPTVGSFQFPKPVISVPFWYWIIAIFIMLTIHETMHALFMQIENVRIKNYGIILFFTLPIGAFVDQDMRRIKKLGFIKKLRFFTAGSFGNISVGFVCLLLLIVSARLYSPYGIAIVRTLEGFPANQSNLSGIILEINGTRIKSMKDLSLILNNTAPGTMINITTTTGNYLLKTVAKPDNGNGSYLGFVGYDFYEINIKYANLKSLIEVMRNLFYWLFILNLGIGTANLLPAKPLDGGYIVEEFFSKIFKKNAKVATYICTAIIWSLIILNLFVFGYFKILG